jgi:hypothetical protein
MRVFLSISIMLAVMTINPYTVVAGTAYKAEINKLGAVGNALESIDKRLEIVLMDQPKMPAPEGIIGRLDAMANKLEVLDNKVMKLLGALPQEAASMPSQVEVAVENIGEISVHIADRARVCFIQLPDNLAVMEALGGVQSLAEKISSRVHIYVSSFWDKVIPIRFVQVHNCYPCLQGCDPHLDRDSLQASVDGANEAFGEAGLHFVIKSVERYYMYNFAHESFPKDSIIEWADAVNEIGQVFPIVDLLDPPPNRDAAAWLGYMSTVFSDPTELLVWVVGYDSLVSRQIDHHSVSTLPNRGRNLIISAQNIYNPNRPPQQQPALSPYNLTHEMGHFFGLQHPWEMWHEPIGRHPVEDRQVDLTDLWDLIYCPGALGFPLYFSSKDDAESADCTLNMIESNPCPCGETDPATDQCTCPVSPNCLVNNRYGADDSDMECTIQIEDIPYSYVSGDSFMKGFSFDLGTAEDPPDDVEDYTYSFAWGLNVMGYYSRFNAHLWTPGRFSDSQLDLIRGYANNSVQIENYYSPFENLWSQMDLLGTN